MLGLVVGAFMNIFEVDLARAIESPLSFYAVNTGYKDTESSQNYDFFELRKNTDNPLSLEGYSVLYLNSSGTETEIILPSAVLVENSLVFGYSKSPQYAENDSRLLYNIGSAGLASTAGTLRLLFNGEIVDELCWGSASCENNIGKFATSEQDNFSYVFDGMSFAADKYYPEININSLEFEEEELALCLGLEITEVFSYYESSADEQFIEIQNASSEGINTLGCFLRFKNKQSPLPEQQLSPGDYLVYRPNGFSLTKDPTNELSLEIIDGAGQVVDSVFYGHGQKTGVSNMLDLDGE